MRYGEKKQVGIFTTHTPPWLNVKSLNSLAKLILYYLERALWFQFESHCLQPFRHEQAKRAQHNSGNFSMEQIFGSNSMGMTGDHITLPLFYPLNNGQQIRNYMDLKTRVLPIWTTFCQKVVGKKSKVLAELLFEIRQEAR